MYPYGTGKKGSRSFPDNEDLRIKKSRKIKAFKHLKLNMTPF